MRKTDLKLVLATLLLVVLLATLAVALTPLTKAASPNGNHRADYEVSPFISYEIFPFSSYRISPFGSYKVSPFSSDASPFHSY